MIQSLEITSFRRLKHLTMSGFAPLNLIVGKNNCGKTTLLEAIQLLSSKTPVPDLKAMLVARGEMGPRELFSLEKSAQLFHGRNLASPSPIRIASEDSQVAITLTGDGDDKAIALYSSTADYEWDLLAQIPTWDRPQSPSAPAASILLPLQAPRVSELQAQWEFLKRKGKASHIIAILQGFDAEIYDLDYFSTTVPPMFQVRLKSASEFVPIGSMGDGVMRLLAIALAAGTRNGEVLLIDELDTGFHYSALEQLWLMLHKFSSESGTQIFATTHSLDCINAVARLIHNKQMPADQFALHRLSASSDSSTVYTGNEVATAIEHEIEVR